MLGAPRQGAKRSFANVVILMAAYPRLLQIPDSLQRRRVSGADRRTKPGQVRPADRQVPSYGDFGFGGVCGADGVLPDGGTDRINQACFR